VKGINMADYTTKDAVNFAIDGKSGEFKNAIHDILADRVQSAIEIKKVDVTANFMKADDDVDTLPSEVEPEVEPEATEDQSDETTEV
tara:strand:- start:1043 stop:1303 length:261 start_codon:yes stop_codon:yes gene_type:complete